MANKRLFGYVLLEVINSAISGLWRQVHTFSRRRKGQRLSKLTLSIDIILFIIKFFNDALPNFLQLLFPEFIFMGLHILSFNQLLVYSLYILLR